jgi:hypothetical protein
MALLLKSGAVFIHIPKTGGNWVTSILTKMGVVDREVGDKHSDFARTYHALHQLENHSWVERLKGAKVTLQAPRDTFYFSFVRNPLKWYESWFKYMNQASRSWCDWGTRGNPSDWHPNSPLNGTGSIDFSEFLGRALSTRYGFVTEMFFAATPEYVNFVGRQENIRADLIEALTLANENFDEALIMESAPVGVSKPEKIIKPVWSYQDALKVAQAEWAAIQRFQYSEVDKSPHDFTVDFVDKNHQV